MMSRLGKKVRVATLGLSLAAVLSLASPAGGALTSANRDDGSHSYLALGDSVAFGYITQDGFDYRNAANFIGYPQYVGDALGLRTVNAACPGEATSGFISATGSDNGCRPYKSVFPLHVSYSGTQLGFALAYLKGHRNTRLVTVALGANDVFLLEERCKGQIPCILKGLPATLAAVRANLGTILRDIRATRFHGVLMLVDYYSVDYTNGLQTLGTEEFNAAETAEVKVYGAVVAHVFQAFQRAADRRAGGVTCQAALLNPNPANPGLCDVHPSQSGQQLIADTVEGTYLAACDRDDGSGGPADASAGQEGCDSSD